MIKIFRLPSTKNGTFGTMLNENNEPLCVTCEDPWEKNERMISCIPEGTYKFKKFSGKKFKDVWEIYDVPGRSAILIHAGNTINDTHGCILVGRSFSKIGSLPSIMQSQAALEMLREKLPNEGIIKIINPKEN